jgi:hypothetical protein
MQEYIRKTYVENNAEKSLYNINSFRGLQSDKSKAEREISRIPLNAVNSNNVISPRILPNPGDKAGETDNKKREVKPRLLTAKLPPAFDVKYKRYISIYL